MIKTYVPCSFFIFWVEITSQKKTLQVWDSPPGGGLITTKRPILEGSKLMQMFQIDIYWFDVMQM